MNRRLISVILYIILVLSSSLSSALEKPTHERLNEVIASTSINGFSLKDYLIKELGFAGGIDDTVNKKKIIKWITDGGKAEDEPMYTRSLNHFHDPLKTWDSAGLKGISQSSILWAQDQGLFGSLLGGKYSWKAVREYYYIALTGKDFDGALVVSTQLEREKYFGYTFQGIGQIMHLVEDMSVPAHTRDDIHVLDEPYEVAVDKFRTSDDLQERIIFDNALANPVPFDPVILTYTPNPLAPIPIAKIFDTDQYNSAAPDPTVTAGTAIGLAEYANANFVSEGLFAANFNDYPYPRIEGTTITETSHASPFGTYMRQYYKKNCCGETNRGQGYLLAAVDFLDYYRNQYPLLSFALPKIPVLDDNVYKDYATLLIPRAVGYSAGLLNYFFRGDIDLADDTETGSGYVIVNNTEENMDGTFELYYDDSDDERIMLWSYSFTLGTLSSGNNKSSNVQLNLPYDAKRYALVFRGRLGNEEEAVVGRVHELNRDFLFLVNLDRQQTAFEIKPANNQYQLIPATDKDININTSYGSTSLTVQSHPNKKEHTAMLPISRYNADSSFQTSYGPTLIGESKYGKRFDYDSWWHDIVKGFPQAYVPINFAEGSPYAWDSGFTYGEWVSGQDGIRLANYIHGRRPFEVIDNKLAARNINIRKNGAYAYSGSDYAGPFHIQYKDETGNWVRGIDLPEGNDYLAVLDRNKTIHTNTDGSDSSQYSSESGGAMEEIITRTRTYNDFIDYSPCERTVTTRTTESFTVGYNVSSSTSSGHSRLVVGDNIIEEFMSESYRNGRSPYNIDSTTSGLEIISDSNPDCCCSGPAVSGYDSIVSTISGDTVTLTKDGEPYTSFIEYGNSDSSERKFRGVMDYDHMDGDKNYILFYVYDDNDFHSSSQSATGVGITGTGDNVVVINDFGYDEIFNSEYTNIIRTGYVMVYKIGNMLNKTDLGVSFTRSASELYSDYVWTKNYNLTGNRISGLSCQINDTNMGYTYIVERNNADGNNWVTDWVFDRRIVGIINISDNALPIGFRQEFELDFSGANFDSSQLAAIGVAR
ncbi:MAG: hypothetical protein HZA14_04740 [Nitrospirae bacterium]|nr:hypothetical protein [Nitrospirota bacterium]